MMLDCDRFLSPSDLFPTAAQRAVDGGLLLGKLKMNFADTHTMAEIINVKTLRRDMARILERVARGERFTVLYRSKPVCRLVPIESADLDAGRVREDPLFGMAPVGRSTDDRSAADHDDDLYGESSA